MKFLAWVMFLTTTACFVTVFCQQQLESQINADNSAFSRPTESWRLAMASCERDDAEQLAVAQFANVATTRPALATGTNAAAAPMSQATVATNDFSNAIK